MGKREVAGGGLSFRLTPFPSAMLRINSMLRVSGGGSDCTGYTLGSALRGRFRSSSMVMPNTAMPAYVNSASV